MPAIGANLTVVTFGFSRCVCGTTGALQCIITLTLCLPEGQGISGSRSFGVTAPALARVVRKKVQKKKVQKKKTLVSVRDREKMTLSDAIDILRVRDTRQAIVRLTLTCLTGRGSSVAKIYV